MEPATPPPAIDYYYVGEGAQDFCAGGYDAVVLAMEMKRGWSTKGAPEGPAIKAWRSGPLGYSTVLKEQPAYPAVVIYYHAPGGWTVSSACGYGDETAFRQLMAISGVATGAVGVYRQPRR